MCNRDRKSNDIREDQCFQPDISLIIPIYNGRQYVPDLLKMIKTQQVTSLEVILVDDGSTDGSSDAIISALTEEYGEELRYESFLDALVSTQIIWRLIQEENQGQGAARNTGLQAANGKWIAFMDQDDRLKESYLQTMHAEAEASGCDILISGYDRIQSDWSVIEHVSLIDTAWSRFMNGTPWGKLYRTSYLREHNIRFYPTPLGEDVFFMLMTEALRPHIQITPYVGYGWVNNRASVSNTVHRRLDPEASILTLVQRIETEISGLDYTNYELQYYFLKLIVYHVLLVARNSDKKAVLVYNRELFTWIENKCPMLWKNPLLRPGKPIGERWRIRMVVWGYAMLHRLHLDSIVLGLYCRIG